MVRAVRLKVFRTAIGFHDAYVVAPSRKAALPAWGSDKDLFTRAVAEQVDDEALAALPPDLPKRAAPTAESGDRIGDGAAPRGKDGRSAGRPYARAESKPGSPAPPAPRAKPAIKPRPRSSRAELDAAEAVVNAAERRRTERLAAMREREQALARERRVLRAEQEVELRDLVRSCERAERTYGKVLARWREKNA